MELESDWPDPQGKKEQRCMDRGEDKGKTEVEEEEKAARSTTHNKILPGGEREAHRAIIYHVKGIAFGVPDKCSPIGHACPNKRRKSSMAAAAAHSHGAAPA